MEIYKWKVGSRSKTELKRKRSPNQYIISNTPQTIDEANFQLMGAFVLQRAYHIPDSFISATNHGFRCQPNSLMPSRISFLPSGIHSSVKSHLKQNNIHIVSTLSLQRGYRGGPVQKSYRAEQSGC